VRPHLQDVRDATGDSTSLAVLSGSEILYLVHVSTNRMIRLVAGSGTRFPVYATSLGRILMAYQAPERIRRYLTDVKLQRFTDKTVSSKDKLKRILKQCRENGYASIQDELDYGIVSVAVPVFAEDGTIIAAINCSTATSRVTEKDMVETRLPKLQAAARRIEIDLSRYPILEHSIRSAAD
jgi:IclR family pca regulon transcriptional regulator